MAARKRTTVERENDLGTIARLYLNRTPQHEIAAALDLSRQQIGYDLKELLRRWKEEALYDFDEAVGRELARLDMLERAAWEGWERSVGTVVSKRELSPPKTGNKGRSRKRNATGSGYLLDALETRDQAGDPKFLAVILRCVEARARILGLADFDGKGDQDGIEHGAGRAALERLLLSATTAGRASSGPLVPQ